MKRSTLFHIILVFSASIFVSCKDKDKIAEGNNQIIHFDVSGWTNNHKIPWTVISKLKFIPLETNANCIMGEPRKLCLHNNKFYLTDMGVNKRIFIFNTSGNYLGSIGSYGKGPGEFINLTDFFINKTQNQLFVLDNDQRKVIVYDLQTAKFLYDFKITFSAHDFAMIDENKLVFYSKVPQNKSGKSFSIAIMNLDDKSYNWFLAQDELDTSLSGINSIFQSFNTYYAPYLKDIVYRITSNSIEPAILFNFGKNKLPEERLKDFRKNPRIILDLLKERKDWTYGIENVLETDKFLTFNLEVSRNTVIVIYSKETGSFFYGNQYEDLLGVFPQFINIAASENEFYGFINSYFFVRGKDKILQQNNWILKEEYLKAINSIQEESNPVIISIEYNSF